MGVGGGVSQKMTQDDMGGGGGLEKMTDDNDREEGWQQENYANWKIESGPNFFKVLECGVGKNCSK